MKQLRMLLPVVKKPNRTSLPEGYSVSLYQNETDVDGWMDCCKDSLLYEGADKSCFVNTVVNHPDIDMKHDVFFLDHGGEHVGTITAVTHGTLGEFHMVSLRADHRGKGLGKYLNEIALEHLALSGATRAYLTTDDFRLPAIVGYIRAGFLPVDYDVDMDTRWIDVISQIGVDSLPLVNDKGSLVKTLYAVHKENKGPVRIGVFGAGRGREMMRFCRCNSDAVLVAVCDSYEPSVKKAKELINDETVTFYTDFDAFIKHDMDAVVLANYANAHAPYAVRCLKAGKHVYSEVLPVQTLQEAVELVEAVEQSGRIYYYGENYCFRRDCRQIMRMYRRGDIGAFTYAEGEYLHNCEPEWEELTRCDPSHWRNTMSAFYYCTHASGPLVHITGRRPVKVSGFEMPYDDRMQRMGAFAAPFAVEMVTLEDGTVVKVAQGTGVSRSNCWYTFYGENGRLESARYDTEAYRSDTGTLYANYGPSIEKKESYQIDTQDAISSQAKSFWHGGGDYLTMYYFVNTILGDRNADVIDVYEALDMAFVGLFGFRSALNGNLPMEIPDFRDKAVREQYRNDTACTDAAVAGDQLQPTKVGGTPVIPEQVYDQLKKQWAEKQAKQS